MLNVLIALSKLLPALLESFAPLLPRPSDPAHVPSSTIVERMAVQVITAYSQESSFHDAMQQITPEAQQAIEQILASMQQKAPTTAINRAPAPISAPPRKPAQPLSMNFSNFIKKGT